MTAAGSRGAAARARAPRCTPSARAGFTPPVMRQLEKFVLLQTIDQLWKEHLLNMDHLKEGIGLRGYGAAQALCRSTRRRGSRCSRR